MNDEESFALEELERDIETLKQFLNEEKPKAADLEEVSEGAEEPTPVPVAEAPKPKAKSKPKAPKPKVKEAEEVVKVEVPAPAITVSTPASSPTRLYGAAKLRAKRGR